jgi:hypothetical protein
MKRLLLGLALVTVLAFAAFAVLKLGRAPSPVTSGETPATRSQRPGEAAPRLAAPSVDLRVNGLPSGAAPFVLTLGEPVLVEVQLRHPDRRAKDPIRLEPPSGNWAERVKIVVTDAGGKAAEWPFVVTGRPSAGGLALQPSAVTTLVLRIDQGARSAVVPGSYRMSARLDLDDGRGFRGKVDSAPASVDVVAPQAPPVGAALGRRQLLRVRDALLRGDAAAADTSAMEMLRAEPRRPESFIALALVQEARGERSRAILSTETAISRVLDGLEPEPAPASGKPAPRQKAGPKQATKPVPKPVPVEYVELLHRLERLPPDQKTPH